MNNGLEFFSRSNIDGNAMKNQIYIVRTFNFNDTLDFESDYSSERFNRIGIGNTTGKNGHT